MQNVGKIEAKHRNLHKLALHCNSYYLNHASLSFHFNMIRQEVINGDTLPCIKLERINLASHLWYCLFGKTNFPHIEQFFSHVTPEISSSLFSKYT